MIMFFADVHLGHRLYQTLTEDNITESEQDTRNALEALYDRMCKPDIELIICGGDFFNAARPSTESIRWAIVWFKKVDAIGKPFYIIPGNHDISAHSNSLVFLKSLKTQNIFLLDKSISKISWNNWNIYFAPFLSPESSKNKYKTTLEAMSVTMHSLNPNENNIVITHIQESEAKLGAERMLLTQSGDIMDLNFPIAHTNTLILTGHMHMPQAYQKENGIRVIYPGSTCFMEYPDCGQKKGFITLDEQGTIDFEPIPGIRIFKKYTLPVGKDPQEFFSSIRMSPNEVVFLELQDDTIADESFLREYLKTRNCFLAKILSKVEETAAVTVDTTSKHPILILQDYLANKFSVENPDFDWKNTILPLGKEILANETELSGD